MREILIYCCFGFSQYEIECLWVFLLDLVEFYGQAEEG